MADIRDQMAMLDAANSAPPKKTTTTGTTAPVASYAPAPQTYTQPTSKPAPAPSDPAPHGQLGPSTLSYAPEEPVYTRKATSTSTPSSGTTSTKTATKTATTSKVSSGSTGTPTQPAPAGGTVSSALSIPEIKVTGMSQEQIDQRNEVMVMIAGLIEQSRQPNPYMEQMVNMTFDYDVTQDPQFAKNAAQIENTVTQLMTRRNGIYSSVARSMLNVKLIDLQVAMTDQAYTAFKDERAFLFEMAKYHDDSMRTTFNQAMQLAGYQLDLDKFEMARQKQEFDQQMDTVRLSLQAQKQEFDQQMAIANYNLNVQKQQFDQQMAVANHNLRAAELAHKREMDAMNYALREAQAIFDMEQKQQKANLDANQNIMYANVAKYEERVANVDWALNQMKVDGSAINPRVQEILGVKSWHTEKSGAYFINKTLTELSAWKDTIEYQAVDLGMAKDVFKITSAGGSSSSSGTSSTSWSTQYGWTPTGEWGVVSSSLSGKNEQQTPTNLNMVPPAYNPSTVTRVSGSGYVK